MSIFDRMKNSPDHDRFGEFRLDREGAPKIDLAEQERQNGVSVYRPKSYRDVVEIVEHLRTQSAIVYLDEVKDSTAQRVSDILSGAILALNGSMYEIQPHIFIYSPGNMNVKVDDVK